MSTMITEYESHWVVASVTGYGKRRRIPRMPVAIEKGDLEALRAEVEKQAEATRVQGGLPPANGRPVV